MLACSFPYVSGMVDILIAHLDLGILKPELDVLKVYVYSSLED